jgi:argininosuccinate lyase
MIHDFSVINQNPLGACAVGGTSFPINRQRTTELLGFDGFIFNSIDAVSSRDHLLSVLMNLTLIADCFTRIAEDFIIFSSHEFKYVELDDKYCSVSSAMPQKKNPDTLELLKGKMGRIFGGLNQMLYITKGLPTGYSRDLQETKPPLIESFKTIKTSADILIRIINTVKLNPKKMLDALNNSNILALDLAEFLSIHLGLSFRESHNIVGALVNEHGKWERIIDKENIQAAIKGIFKKNVKIDQEILDKFNNFQKVLENRKSAGAPNKKNIARSIEEVSILNKKLSEDLSDISKLILDSESALLNLAERLITD